MLNTFSARLFEITSNTYQTRLKFSLLLFKVHFGKKNEVLVIWKKAITEINRHKTSVVFNTICCLNAQDN